jgi:hypothetical protein
MAAPTFTIANHPAGYDQTQRRFRLSGLLGLSGNYTISTGISINFIGILNSSGAVVNIPPTYDGPNGPGSSVPLPTTEITSVGGYQLWFDPTNKSIRIWNGTTEVANGTIPAALTAAGIPATFEFLRG